MAVTCINKIGSLKMWLMKSVIQRTHGVFVWNAFYIITYIQMAFSSMCISKNTIFIQVRVFEVIVKFFDGDKNDLGVSCIIW